MLSSDSLPLSTNCSESPAEAGVREVCCDRLEDAASFSFSEDRVFGNVKANDGETFSFACFVVDGLDRSSFFFMDSLLSRETESVSKLQVHKIYLLRDRRSLENSNRSGKSESAVCRSSSSDYPSVSYCQISERFAVY